MAVVARGEVWESTTDGVPSPGSMKARSVLPLAASLALSALALGCGPKRPFVWIQALPPEQGPPKIQVGDGISVQVKSQSTLSGEFPVRANGAFLLPVAGEVAVAGLSPEEAAQRVAKRLDGIVVNPMVQVSVSTPRGVRVSVVGEVRTPGAYELTKRERLLDVLARAGGLAEFADRDGIYVLRDAEPPVRIRFRWADLTSGEPTSASFRVQDGDVIVVE